MGNIFLACGLLINTMRNCYGYTDMGNWRHFLHHRHAGYFLDFLQA